MILFLSDNLRRLWSEAAERDKAICNVCNLEVLRNKVTRHLREVHSIGLVVHKCPACNKEFKRRYIYEKHVASCSAKLLF